MQLIDPNVLVEARGLSPLFGGAGVVLGGLIWTLGWHWHRFWVVVAITLCGGLIGLQTGRASGGHILAMGLLLALASGLLALELARFISFLAAGTAAWLAASVLFPRDHELWISFLLGGLLGILLYRFWTMMLTSFVGIMIGWHSFLNLLDSIFRIDIPAFATGNGLVLNGAVIAATCLGVVVQSFYDRWQLRRKRRRQEAEEERMLQKEREKERQKILASVAKPAEPPSLWERLMGKKKAA